MYIPCHDVQNFLLAYRETGQKGRRILERVLHSGIVWYWYYNETEPSKYCNEELFESLVFVQCDKNSDDNQ